MNYCLPIFLAFCKVDGRIGVTFHLDFQRERNTPFVSHSGVCGYNFQFSTRQQERNILRLGLQVKRILQLVQIQDSSYEPGYFFYFFCLDSCPPDVKNCWLEVTGSRRGFWLILGPLHGQYSEKQAPTTQNYSSMSWINMSAILQVLTMNATWDNRPCLSEK